MASRIVFLPTAQEEGALFTEHLVSFEWVPGMAISQGTKSVLNLHAAARLDLGIDRILEISTRSPEHFGISLSAFNLQVEVSDKLVSVEVAYQSSKVFSDGGPYLDLLNGSSMDAKQDLRLKTSGDLQGFKFEENSWPLNGNPNFYDYLYIKGLVNSPDNKELLNYDGFTDIAFNQNRSARSGRKSFNCQARSAAIYCSLLNRTEGNQVLDFLLDLSKIESKKPEQLGLF
jgi:hypothetical protein